MPEITLKTPCGPDRSRPAESEVAALPRRIGGNGDPDRGIAVSPLDGRKRLPAGV